MPRVQARAERDNTVIARPTLAFAAVLAVACFAVVLSPAPTAPRVLAGVALVLILPGYALMAALFAPLTVSPVQVALLSTALSVAIAVLGTLVVNALPVELGTLVWASLLLAATLVFSAVAFVRLGNPPASPTTRPALPSLIQAAALLIASGLAAGAIVVARHPVSASGASGYTALSIRQPTASPRTVVLSVQSNELEPTSYLLAIAAGNRRVERHFSLEPGQTRTVELVVAGSATSVDARLFKNESEATYRRVRLVLGPVAG